MTDAKREAEFLYYLRRLPVDKRDAYMEHLRQVSAERAALEKEAIALIMSMTDEQCEILLSAMRLPEDEQESYIDHRLQQIAAQKEGGTIREAV